MSMRVELFDKSGKAHRAQQCGLGNRPAAYPFRQMQLGWYFTAPAHKDYVVRRVDSMRFYSAASKFASRNPEYGFSVEYDHAAKLLVVTRTK